MRTALLITLSLFATHASAQDLTVPEMSPAAAVEQTIGITNVRVSYHQPAVNGRKVWGELVPYNDVWRAGANENTTISFSTPVKIGGKVLAAGTYGLHMIPAEKEWTIILSNVSVAWGSYGYDQKEDAVRVKVVPQATDVSQERLIYAFEDVSTLVMRWEKVKIALKIEVDTPAAVMAKMKLELRGGAQFRQEAWEQAARYWLEHGGSLDEAAKMADRSMSSKETYKNVTTRARIAEKKGDKKLAQTLLAKADTLATEADYNTQGYELLFAKKHDEAIAVFVKNTQAFPTSWNTFDSLGEAYVVKGDKVSAATAYKKALALVKDADNKKRIEQILARLGG